MYNNLIIMKTLRLDKIMKKNLKITNKLTILLITEGTWVTDTTFADEVICWFLFICLFDDWICVTVAIQCFNGVLCWLLVTWCLRSLWLIVFEDKLMVVPACLGLVNTWIVATDLEDFWGGLLERGDLTLKSTLVVDWCFEFGLWVGVVLKVKTYKNMKNPMKYCIYWIFLCVGIICVKTVSTLFMLFQMHTHFYFFFK